MTTITIALFALAVAALYYISLYVPFEVDEPFLKDKLDPSVFWCFNPNDWSAFCIMMSDCNMLVLPTRMNKSLFIRICRLNGILLRSK